MSAAIALDLGSTAIKAGLLLDDGSLSHIVSRPAPKIQINNGRYESDALAYAQIAEQLLADTLTTARGLSPLGLCSQRSSFLIWDRHSGQPLTPLISWQDNRGLAPCNDLQAHRTLIFELTGLPLTAYYFGPKLSQLLQENPSWKIPLEQGEYRVGTLDSFLIWRWTDGKQFVTDASMAARTQLMDIHTQQWSTALCQLFGIPLSALPEIKASVGMNVPLNNGLILQASLGDQSAALIAGTGCDDRKALVNLGTGGFVIRVQAKDTMLPEGFLHTLVYQGQETLIAAEGTLNAIAIALAPYPVASCTTLAEDALFCIAETSGLGAPYFTDRFLASCFSDPKHPELGRCFSESVAHLSPHRIATLLIEAIIFRVAGILEEFNAASALDTVYLSGGLASLACLRQGIAACAPCEVHYLIQQESSLLGAAMLAAGIKNQRHSEKIIPAGDTQLIEKYRRWQCWLDEILAK